MIEYRGVSGKRVAHQHPRGDKHGTIDEEFGIWHGAP